MADNKKISEIPAAQHLYGTDRVVLAGGAPGTTKTTEGAMLDDLLAYFSLNGYFAGIAQTDTDPGQPVLKKFWFAKAGTYTNFKDANGKAITIADKDANSNPLLFAIITTQGTVSEALPANALLSGYATVAEVGGFGPAIQYNKDQVGVLSGFCYKRKIIIRSINDNATVNADGSVEGASDCAISDYGPVSPGQLFIIDNITSNKRTTSCLIAFYDSAKTFISGIVKGPLVVIASTGFFAAPANAAYYKMSWATAAGLPTINTVFNPTNAIINALPKTALDLGSPIGGRNLNFDGSIYSSGGAGTLSQYVPVTPEYSYVIENITANKYETAFLLAFYDTNKTYIANSLYPAKPSALITKTNIIVAPAGAAYALVNWKADTDTPTFSVLNGVYQQAINTSNQKENEARLQLLEFNEMDLTIGLNKYDRTSPGNQEALGLIAGGEIVFAGGQLSLSNYVRIKKGETLKADFYPDYVNRFGSALYDKYKQYIPGSWVNAGSITWQEGAYYARFTMGAGSSNPTNTMQVYDVTNPIIGKFVPFSQTVPATYLPATSATVSKISVKVVGDSIAAGIGSTINTLLPDGLDGRNVDNAAVGGETTLDTCARLGCLPYMVEPFTIPATITPVTITLSSSFKYKVNFSTTDLSIQSESSALRINPYGQMTASIAGIPGLIKFAGGNTPRQATFTRSGAGDAVAITSPTMVKPLAVDRNTVIVAFMGTNGGWKADDYGTTTLADADNLITQYQAIADWIRPTSNDFVFLGFYTGVPSAEWMLYFETQMAMRFGVRYIPINTYLRTYGWRDAGIKSLTQSDIDRVNSYQVPLALLADTVHPNLQGGRPMVNEVLKRLQIIGVTDTIYQVPIAPLS